MRTRSPGRPSSPVGRCSSDGRDHRQAHRAAEELEATFLLRLGNVLRLLTPKRSLELRDLEVEAVVSGWQSELSLAG